MKNPVVLTMQVVDNGILTFFFSQKFQFLLKFKSRSEKSLSFSVFGVLFL